MNAPEWRDGARVRFAGTDHRGTVKPPPPGIDADPIRVWVVWDDGDPRELDPAGDAP